MNTRALSLSLLFLPTLVACGGTGSPQPGDTSPAVVATTSSITGRADTSANPNAVKAVYTPSNTRGNTVAVTSKTFSYPLPTQLSDTITRPITEMNFGNKNCGANTDSISDPSARVTLLSYLDFFENTTFIGYGVAGKVEGNVTTAYLWYYSTKATDVTSKKTCTDAQGVKHNDTVHFKLRPGWNSTVLTVTKNADGSKTNTWYTQPVGTTDWAIELPASTQALPERSLR